MQSATVQPLREGPLFALGQAMEIISEASRDVRVLQAVFEGIFDNDPAFSQRCAYVIEHLTRRQFSLNEEQFHRLMTLEFFSTRRWLAAFLPPLLSRAPWEPSSARNFALLLCEQFDNRSNPVGVRTACLQALFDLAARFPELHELLHPRLYAGLTSDSTALRIRCYMLLGTEAGPEDAD